MWCDLSDVNPQHGGGSLCCGLFVHVSMHPCIYSDAYTCLCIIIYVVLHVTGNSCPP